MHSTYGLPSCPGGHWHLAMCLLTLQEAFMPHCSNGQGSWHSLWIHACVKVHSWSLLQPAKKGWNKTYMNMTLCETQQKKSYVLHKSYKDHRQSLGCRCIKLDAG